MFRLVGRIGAMGLEYSILNRGAHMARFHCISSCGVGGRGIQYGFCVNSDNSGRGLVRMIYRLYRFHPQKSGVAFLYQRAADRVTLPLP